MTFHRKVLVEWYSKDIGFVRWPFGEKREKKPTLHT